MSGPPRIRSMNVPDSESRLVLAPAGNKSRTTDVLKPASKHLKKSDKALQEIQAKEKKPVAHSISQLVSVPTLLKRQDNNQVILNLSMNASCSSDASSTDSSTHSRASNGKVVGPVSAPLWKKQSGLKVEKVEKVGIDNVVTPDTVLPDSNDSLDNKKRCAWVTSNTDPCYAAFHDGEWVFLFMMTRSCLSCSASLELWPNLHGLPFLAKGRYSGIDIILWEIFLEFDPIAVSQMNERKKAAPGSPSSLLLSEFRLRTIIENARQICKVVDEFGSFHAFIGNFVNHKPIVSQFRYPRQVPVKSPKAEIISKDLLRRGFRSVGPTVIYTFMQVAGLTNDHLISCFRFKECVANAEAMEKEGFVNSKVKKKKANEEPSEVSLLVAVDKLGFTSK